MTLSRVPADAPSPPPRCPSCGGVMGDGDRARRGRCALCQHRLRHAARCWCGRAISTLPDATGLECAEHDRPIPAAAYAPSAPTTPGGVYGDRGI